MSIKSRSAAVQLSQRALGIAQQPIADLMARALANPQLISLAAGFVDQQTLPNEATQGALESIFADPQQARAALQYGTTPGYPPLREALLDRFLQCERLTAEQAHLSVEQVVVAAGSNALLHLVGEVLFDPGDIVLCAAPTYLVYLGTVSTHGAQAIGVTTDEHGIQPEALDEQLADLARSGQLPRVKAVYVVSYFDNPCGVSLPADRRIQLIEICRRWSVEHRIYLIEDAAYRELRYDGDDLPSIRHFDDAGDTVVTTGTFSKSFSPGIRVGWALLPPALVGPVCEHKANIDFGSPNLMQHLMARVLEMGLLDGHIERLRDGYRTKLQTMLDAADELLAPIEEIDWIRPSGGLYVWARLPESIRTGPSGKLFDRAVAEGVLYVPGEYFYPPAGMPTAYNTIRLSFGVQPCESIRLGIEALARAIEQTA